MFAKTTLAALALTLAGLSAASASTVSKQQVTSVDAFGNRITKVRVSRTDDFGNRVSAVRLSRTDLFGNRVSATRVSRTDEFGDRVSTVRVVRTSGLGLFCAAHGRPPPTPATAELRRASSCPRNMDAARVDVSAWNP